MRKQRLSDTILTWLRGRFATRHTPLVPTRGPRTHVIILDGTMSSLSPGEESNAGLAYRLLQDVPGLSLYYEAGIQWAGWGSTPDVLLGRGINRQIRRAYGFLASRYHPGDRIYLLGYSRGAYAVRSLAGVIDKVGLLRADAAMVRNVRQAYRLYQFPHEQASLEAFRAAHCHPQTTIEMIGAWDTVKALGWRLPLIWKLSAPHHDFHDHHLSACVRAGFHALALDETRDVYAPVMWESGDTWQGRLEQVWFRGNHGDVGGQLGGFHAARPLSNIPLVWMLAQMEGCGLSLPPDWRARFPTDSDAPSTGQWRGFSKFFLLRSARNVGEDPSERIHVLADRRKVAAKRVAVGL